MADHISRQAAIEEIRNDPMGGLNYKRILTDIPAADVVPVRHARWIRIESFVNGTVTRIYKCSRCDGVAGVRADNGFWYKSNFCPNCGAKMDGGDEHG